MGVEGIHVISANMQRKVGISVILANMQQKWEHWRSFAKEMQISQFFAQQKVGISVNFANMQEKVGKAWFRRTCNKWGKNVIYTPAPCGVKLNFRDFSQNLTRVPLSRLQTTFWHCSLTLETTKKRLETRDYKKMRFRRAAAVTFFFWRRRGSPGRGIPNFPPRCARLSILSVFWSVLSILYIVKC